ncbi:hypothetical protein ACWDRB_32780 [Nonomuraea sp. NPDC003707]
MQHRDVLWHRDVLQHRDVLWHYDVLRHHDLLPHYDQVLIPFSSRHRPPHPSRSPHAQLHPGS